MKKIIAVLLVICCCIGLCACGNTNSANTEDPLKNVKANTDEYVKNTISKVITTSNDTGLTKEKIMNTLVITYTDEQVSGDSFSYMATYRITLGSRYYYYEFDVSGTLSSGTADVSLIRNYDESSGSDTNYAETISVSNRIAIAEEEAVNALVEYLYTSQEYKNYDIDSTKYKIGKTTQGSGTAEEYFTVNGTLALYDVYGKLAKTPTFSVTVIVDAFGDCRAMTPKID